MSFDSDVALTVTDVSKCYRLFKRPQDRLKQGLWRGRQYFNEFWALRGVSLSVKRGETVGIVGRNGSGKSTLLQIIAGTLTPTAGSVQLRGRVAPLLELGTGFNPDFTGRENVFLNASILGLTRAETESHFDEIVDFAEIADFIDQPVRTYSSGMIVRLAFAVQAIIPKDVLIVDEILAVGDEAFQRKCFAKIEDFRSRNGTILLVSHNAGAIVQLCNRAVLLEDGELLLEGKSQKVVNLYQKLVYASTSSHGALRDEIRNLGAIDDWDKDSDATTGVAAEDEPGAAASPSSAISPDVGKTTELEAMYDPHLVPRSPVRYKSRGAKIEDPHLALPDGTRVNLLRARGLYVWRYRVILTRRLNNVRFGMLIKTISGVELGGMMTDPPGKGFEVIEAGTRVEAQFAFRANLAPGTYFLNAGATAIFPEGDTFVDRWVDAALFKILPDDDQRVWSYVDFMVEPRLSFESAKVEIRQSEN